MSQSSPSTPTKLVAPVIVGLTVCYALIRIIFWFSAEAGGDEAYYWVWGQRPELSYYDHPPMLSWIQGLFASIFGQSIAVLRLPNLLTTGIIFYTYYLISKRLYPDLYRKQFVFIALTLAATPLLFTFMAQAIMDHVLIALLLVSAYLMIFYLEDTALGKSAPVWRLYVGAILLGLAGITKYNSVFLGLGIAITILMHPRLRPLLRQPHVYIAGLLTLAMLTPVILWNFDNNFQSFRYHLVDRNPSSSTLQFRPQIMLGFVIGTILVLSPFTFWMAIRRFFIDSSVKMKDWFRIETHSIYASVALITFVISTGLFLSRSLFTHTLLYWNIPAYLLLVPLIGPILVNHEGKLVRKKLFIGQQVYGILLVGLVLFNFAILPLDVWSQQGAGDRGTRHWYGWQSTADVINRELSQNKKDLILFTTDHHLASALSFTMNRTDIVAVSPRRDQYDLWWDESTYFGRDGLIVFDQWDGINDDVVSLFERIGPTREIEIVKYGYPIKTMYLKRAYKYKGRKTD